tara:strand:+ start:5980 stop:7944 length:1965 start_codon:yes stop_codon:yes gene_type:complete
MCGIAGFVAKLDDMQSTIDSMRATLSHRGPDSSGSWIDKSNGIALGHQRLAIQDLSSAGNQPMQSKSKKLTLIFNGEIYNHFEIREKLQKDVQEKIKWNGHSDTETIITAFEIFGVEKTLKLVKGMFALCLWDSEKEVITLARDRMGEKPLFYGYVNHHLVFASELKSIMKFDGFNNKICKKALVRYFKYNYVPSPYCIFEDLFKLEPGKYIQFKISKKGSSNSAPISNSYWKLNDVFKKGLDESFKDMDSVKIAVENSLTNSIKSQLISDVPLGTFLSGGIDSTLITALLQNSSDTPIKTFTIGFEDRNYDESVFAKDIAKYLGTDHKEMILNEQDAIDVIERLPKIYDEPFADSSQIPTVLVSEIAKSEVTVALSGDGGDELFGGYNRYTHVPSIWKIISIIPYSLRKILGKLLSTININVLDFFGEKFLFLKPIPQFGSKIHKMADRLKNINSLREFSMSLATIWQNPSALVKDMEDFIEDDFNQLSSTFNFIDSETKKMMAVDSVTYLPDDILCKVDRAAMSTSLETRVPFLDPDVISVASRIPLQFNIVNKNGKLPLREILKKYVPQDLTERPKSGFAIPIGEWLRGPLREWAEDLLSKDFIENQGLLNFEPIQKVWKEHLSGKHDWTPKIWGVLMFQAWYKEYQINKN